MPTDRFEIEQPFVPTKVITISEEAMYLKDGGRKTKLVEIGNINYQNMPPIFEYDPRVHMLSVGGKQLREEVIVDTRELFALKDGYGHVSLERLFGNEPRRMVDSQFEVEVYRELREVKRKARLLEYLAKAREIRNVNIDRDMVHYATAADGQNKQYTPEDLLRIVTNEVDEDAVRSNKEAVMASLEALGFFDPDINVQQKNIVNLFYVFMRVKGLENPGVAETKEALQGFEPESFDMLIKEFKKRPDARFGDELLGAISELIREGEEEDAKYASKSG